MYIASIFDTLIVEPLFNLLVVIYALIPGHNFGLSIIIFTVVIRLLMWPLVKKQLHQAKAMRELQPEMKRIKAATKGNRQQESAMLMELYKERGVSPFGSIGTLAIQLVIIFGLYSGLNRVVQDPKAIIDTAYAGVQNLSWLQTLATDITQFDATLFGLIDLKRAALGGDSGLYIPALLLVLGSAVAQFFQSKQVMPQDKDAKSLREILRGAGEGKPAENGEVNAAVGRSTLYILPAFIVFFTISLPAALSLYWLSTGLVAYWQQSRILGQDETEMEALVDGKAEVIEGEVVEKKVTKKPKPKKKSSKKRKKK